MHSPDIDLFVDDFSSLELPAGLENILPFLPSKSKRYRSASWLRSDFDSPIWRVECGNRFEIDWRVPLGDSTELLTDRRHAPLLETLRSWLIVQSHPDFTGKVLETKRPTYQAIRRAGSVIDYILLRCDQLGVRKHGLEALSTGDLKAALGAFSAHNHNSVTVYEWPTRLAAFLRNKKLSPEQRRAAISAAPFLADDIPAREDRLTDLSEEETVDARAWLWVKSHFKKAPANTPFKFGPRSHRIADCLYRGTLFGRSTQLPVPLELCLLQRYRVIRELPRAPVTTCNQHKRSRQALSQLLRVIESLTLLRDDGLAAPELDGPAIESLRHHLDLKPTGRFKTLPFNVVSNCLRQAITFALTYGDALVTSYLSLAREAHSRHLSVSRFAHSCDITPYLTEDLQSLGVRRWTVITRTGAIGERSYFDHLRSNVGLYELIKILYGAVAVVVGALSARRSGELMDLQAFRALDKSRTRLVFYNRKSGTGDMRRRETRPIPPVASRVILMLESLQEGLLETGAIAVPTSLFACPTAVGGSPLVIVERNECDAAIDLFCDYIQVDVDSAGRRYYVRQHQLRRWFAMMFFWGNSFGGVDTLRWFLGHTDMESLYHYITEALPGAVLRDVSAAWAAESLRRGTPETDELAHVVARHFGTTSFKVMDSSQLDLYLEELLETGQLIVEPMFLDRGRTCRICVRITRPEGAEHVQEA